MRWYPERQWSREQDRGRHENVGLARGCFWGPQKSEGRQAAMKVKGEDLGDLEEEEVGRVDRVSGRAEGRVGWAVVAVDCVVGRVEAEEERKRGREWDGIKAGSVGGEAEGGEQNYGRYTQDCQSPNEPSSGQARQDQPSLHMPDRNRSGHAAMYDKRLGQQ